jgi:hypothetical protein
MSAFFFNVAVYGEDLLDNCFFHEPYALSTEFL